MGDAQLSAEYVARAILALAPQSKTGKVNVIGHSQGGGLNIQWARTADYSEAFDAGPPPHPAPAFAPLQG